MRSIYFIWALLARSYRGYKNFGNISTQTHIRRSTTLRQAGHLLCPPHYTALSPMHDDSSTALIDLEVLRGFQSYRGKCHSCHKTSSCISPLGTSLISEHPRLQHFLLYCLFLSSSSNFQTRSLLRDTALLPPSFPKAPSTAKTANCPPSSKFMPPANSDHSSPPAPSRRGAIIYLI
jgi:hypothetical protein